MNKTAALNKLAQAVTGYIKAEQAYNQIIDAMNKHAMQKTAGIMDMFRKAPPPPKSNMGRNAAILGLLGLGGGAAYANKDKLMELLGGSDIGARAQEWAGKNQNPINAGAIPSASSDLPSYYNGATPSSSPVEMLNALKQVMNSYQNPSVFTGAGKNPDSLTEILAKLPGMQ